MDDMPTEANRKEWESRTETKLDTTKSLGENLLQLFRTTDRWVGLWGTCSTVDSFLTDNQIKAICYVRHPVDAYVSLMKNRHPDIAANLGGYNTLQSITAYAYAWRNIVSDCICSGNPVWRYENLRDDCDDGEIGAVLKQGWRPGRQSHTGELSPENEKLLLELTTSQRFYVYGEEEP
jgi:hypothetical protein